MNTNVRNNYGLYMNSDLSAFEIDPTLLSPLKNSGKLCILVRLAQFAIYSQRTTLGPMVMKVTDSINRKRLMALSIHWSAGGRNNLGIEQCRRVNEDARVSRILRWLATVPS